ncbi:hypothetical protein BDN71DRAFT_520080 [Pleurotus eryngii]|uniref:Uncharacterized protein n=1 Tax=Pleurotus eryngii TaxID=5323 RepID=A0A9P5ZJJ8_PLEER|nr:hypothetical protein BDN71DRAFT_520080 [Pleurotus eryngii]
MGCDSAKDGSVDNANAQPFPVPPKALSSARLAYISSLKGTPTYCTARLQQSSGEEMANGSAGLRCHKGCSERQCDGSRSQMSSDPNSPSICHHSLP